MSFAAASTVPVTFLTAQYALHHLGKMRKGDRVLIHAVTGGVGMAATQIALRAGATVFGTAGSPAKKALAKSLGVHHVSDSRSLSFVDDIMRETNGEGVDIVLNSLAGDFIPASLGLLRSGGRFIEIGKTGIWDNARVGAEYPGIDYHALYLGEIAAARPQFVRYMLREILADMDAGVLTPLPQRLYPLERSEDAFRFMGQGLHTGKIVIVQHEAPTIRQDATYLITGGLGGLGLTTAEWLAREGARYLVLAGRRAPDPAAQEVMGRLASSGVNVFAAQVDVSDATHVAGLMEQIAANMPPLRGIMHAAGTIDDAMIVDQTMEQFRRVLAPKVAGTWNLHEQTAALPLDFFVMFSSGAALLGSPGQGNYAAANAFMDALAHVREANGRHALSINWGSWAEVGMAAGVSEEHHRRWESMGMRLISPADGVRVMRDVLFGSTSPQVAIIPLARRELGGELPPFYSELSVRGESAKSDAPAVVNILARLSELGEHDRPSEVTAFLSDQIARVLALGAASRIDPERPLTDMGMDSLMAMELRNRIQTAVNVPVSVASLLAGANVQQLTDTILSTLTPAAAARNGDDGWEEGTL